MDVIISANEKILHVIKEIPVDENGKVDAEKFAALAFEITGRENKSDEDRKI